MTLVEVLVVIVVISLLLAISASALRNFWLVKSLQAAQDDVISQLKQDQQRSESESAPMVYGARFQKGTSTWGTVQYNGNTGACAVVNSVTFDTGVVVANSTDFPDATGTTACRNASPDASANNEVVFFYPSGSATAGSAILSQPAIGRTGTVMVSAVTGRVYKP